MSKVQFISFGWNLLLFAGIILLAYGVWLAWKPGGFILGGLFIAAVGFGGSFESWKEGRRR